MATSRNIRSSSRNSTSEARRDAELRKEREEQEEQSGTSEKLSAPFLASGNSQGARESGFAADGTPYVRETLRQGTADGGTLTQSRLIGQTPEGREFQELTETRSVTQSLKDGSTRTLSETEGVDRAGRAYTTRSDVLRTPDGQENAKSETSYAAQRSASSREGSSVGIRSGGLASAQGLGGLSAKSGGMFGEDASSSREGSSVGIRSGGFDSALGGGVQANGSSMSEARAIGDALSLHAGRTYSLSALESMARGEGVSAQEQKAASAVVAHLDSMTMSSGTGATTSTSVVRDSLTSADSEGGASRLASSSASAHTNDSSSWSGTDESAMTAQAFQRAIADYNSILESQQAPSSNFGAQGGMSAGGTGEARTFEADRLTQSSESMQDLTAQIRTSLSDTRAVGEALTELKDGGYTAADLEVMAEGRTGSPAMQDAARRVLAQADSADPLHGPLERTQAQNAETQQSLTQLMLVANSVAANGEVSPQLHQDLAQQLRALEGALDTEALTAPRGDGNAAVREAYETANAYAQVDGQRLADVLPTPELREAAAAPLDTAATALVREQGEIALPAADGLHALAEALRSGSPQEIADAQAHASATTTELYQHTLELGTQAQPDMTGSAEDRSLTVQVITAEGRAELLADVVRQESPEHALQAVTDLRALSDTLETTSPTLSEAIREGAPQPVEALGQAVSLAREVAHVDVEQYVQAGLTPEQREAAAAPFEATARGLLEEQGPAALAAADSLQAVASALRSGDAQDLTAAQRSAVDQTHDLAASVLEKASERLDTALARDHGESGAQVLEVRATEVTANLENTASYSPVNPQEFAAGTRTPEERMEAAMPLDAAASMLRESGDPAAERAAQSMEALAQELRTGDAKDIERAQATMAEEVTTYVERGRESGSPLAELPAQRDLREGEGESAKSLVAAEPDEQLARSLVAERSDEAAKAVEAEEMSME